MQEKCELYLGNCVDVLSKLINDGIQVDLTITSPPYDNILTYQGTCTWNFDIFKEIANKLYQITKGGCIGCGYDLKQGETTEECIKRMEKEREF